MGVAFAVGAALGLWAGLRLGMWRAFSRLGQYERRERTRRARRPRR